jgi:hypothetical protein
MQIFVNGLSGRTTAVSTASNATVSSLKAQIAAAECARAS